MYFQRTQVLDLGFTVLKLRVHKRDSHKVWKEKLTRKIREDTRGAKMYFWDHKMEVLGNISGIT